MSLPNEDPGLADEPFRLSAESAERVPTMPLTLGKDEMNLAEFPIALVTDRIPSGQKTLKFEDRYLDPKKGQTIRRRLVVTAADEYGLPTAKDDEVILGLIQITRTSNGFRDRTVEFNRADLVRLLRWPDTGPSYKRLTLSLKRWLGVTLYYENAWWDHRQKRWTSLGFHILDDFYLCDGGRVSGPREASSMGPGPAGLSRFTWNENVFRSFAAGHLKRLDLETYFGLELPTAKRLYRFLDKRFLESPQVELELTELAFDHIGLSRNYEGASQLLRKIRPAVEELERNGFLAEMTAAERYRKHSPRYWTVVFRREESKHPADADTIKVEARAGGASAAPEPPATPSTTPEVDTLVSDLVSRGVSAAVAAEIAAGFDLARTREQIEVFDWLLGRREARVMRNPAGFLVQSIRDDYAIPRGFVTSAERARRLETERTQTAARRDQRQREKSAETRARVYWDNLPPAEQERVWTLALAQAAPAVADRYRASLARSPEQAAHFRSLIVMAYLNDLLSESGTPSPA
ncbi:MAG: replication initiator protein A [Isosphaeraceae bacterium]